jgi:para-aminobenzoate synthetase / 4-amino-4-deoxychorismate lyase
VIDARFDDLTGASPSFRLTRPAGVLEATRTDEVPNVLEAAESAAARGLWVAGFVAYEAAPGLDAALAVRAPEASSGSPRLPLAWFAMFEGKEEAVLPLPRQDPGPVVEGAWMPSVDRARYDASIASIRGHIAAGDTYQVNYTMRLRSRIDGDDRGLYRDLCYAQRGRHAAYLNTGRYRVLSASPELFFHIQDGRLTTRPMKGTAPRGRWQAEDDSIAVGLRSSVKERAENAMIVDLLRNDLGRVSRTGSVVWSSVFEPERYETVWQLTSTVTSELEPGQGLVQIFRALFPCGSVTGAPKVRTMELIAELEDSPRGVYCGAVGWLAPSNSDGPKASFNVAIRTVVVDSETGLADYGVGGGITWDSSASGEYEETVAKARVLTARRPPFDLLETMRRDPDAPIHNLDEHLRRLGDSAAYFGFAFPKAEIRMALEASISSRTQEAEPWRVRLRLERDGHFEIGISTLDTREPLPVMVELDDRPVDPADIFLFHKTSLRSRFEEARKRHSDAADVLMVNRLGEVTESTVANLGVKLDGRWWTPALDCGLLAGIGRAEGLKAGTIAERRIRVEELAGAQELALISDLRGWRSARLTGS